MSTFVLKVHLEPKFWRRHCSTGLERNSCMKLFSIFPLEPKSWSRPCLQYSLYCIFISCHLCPPPQIFIRGGPHECTLIVIKPLSHWQLSWSTFLIKRLDQEIEYWMFKKKQVDQEIEDLFKFLESSWKLHVQLQ